MSGYSPTELDDYMYNIGGQERRFPFYDPYFELKYGYDAFYDVGSSGDSDSDEEEIETRDQGPIEYISTES